MSDILLEPDFDAALLDAALPWGKAQGVLQIEDDENWPVRLVEGRETFEGNCCILVEAGTASLHPRNSYETDYYYCRSAIVVNVDAADPSPLLASFDVYAPLMSILLLTQVCGALDLTVTSHIDKVSPPQLFPCGVAAFPAPEGGVYLLVDTAKVILPLFIWMTFTSGEHIRKGYIQIRTGLR